MPSSAPTPASKTLLRSVTAVALQHILFCLLQIWSCYRRFSWLTMAILNNQTIPRRFPLSFHEMELVGEDCKAQPQSVVVMWPRELLLSGIACSTPADTFRNGQVETEGTGLQGAHANSHLHIRPQLCFRCPMSAHPSTNQSAVLEAYPLDSCVIPE